METKVLKVDVYTDGACSGNPGPGGWAAVMSTNGSDEYEIFSGHEDETTNNRMELTAVIEVLKTLKALECKGYHIVATIHSDSAYVVNTVQNNADRLVKWKARGWRTLKGDKVKNADLWKHCYALLSNFKTSPITFVKIKGHSGNPLNEYADTIAKSEVLRGGAKSNG